MEAVEIRLPELSGGSETEQLRRLQSYVFTLAQQLQFAFDSVSREQEQAAKDIANVAEKKEKTPMETFSAIKALIIKSADIVERYSEEIQSQLDGLYVAESEYGTFTQQTRQQIRENAEGIARSFTNLQQVQSRVEGVASALLGVEAYIRTGLLYYTEEEVPVYGVEIGQQEAVNGAVTFRKFARLAADRLSFFDSNDVEVAYISDERLHVTAAELHRASISRLQTSKIELGEYTLSLGADGHLTLS